MQELINYCRGREKEALIRLLTSIGVRYCIPMDKYFSYTVKIIESMDNLEELSIYYYIIEIVNAICLKNNNSCYEKMIIHDINCYFNGFSSKDILICKKFINEFFNEEYRAYFERLSLGGETK